MRSDRVFPDAVPRALHRRLRGLDCIRGLQLPFTTDVARLVEALDPAKAACVVQHDYVPRSASKMDGQVQTTYPRKNWSSSMAFNGANPAIKALTSELVNTQSPAFLHRLF